MLLKTSHVFSREFCTIFQNQATKFGQVIEQEKHFSSNIKLKMRLEDYFQTCFCLLKNFTKDKSQCLKLQVPRPEILLKRNFSTGIFLWVSHNFSKNHFYRILPRVFHKDLGGGGTTTPPFRVVTWYRKWGEQLATSWVSSPYSLMSIWSKIMLCWLH